MNYHTDFIQTLERDFGMILLTQDSVSTDYVETLGGSTADTITYHIEPVTVTSELVTGFILNHHAGATIRGCFEKPVKACHATVDQYGDELEFQDNSGTVARAILKKLGNISLDPDSELKAYAGRP